MEDDRDDRGVAEMADPVEPDADSPPPPSLEPYQPMADLPPSRFVERLSSVPLVKAVFGVASRYYSGAKARSALLAAALATAENAAVAVGRRCEATVRARFGAQLECLDSLSCQGLDLLEDHCPLLLRQPEVIAADVSAFGRRKTAELRQYGFEKVDRVRAVLTTAAHKVAHPVETLASVRDGLSERTDQALDSVNELMDLWISSHNRRYDPSPNGLATPSTLRSRISYAARKFRHAFTLQLSLETSEVKYLASRFYAGCLQAMQEAVSTSDPPETPREHAIIAARHLLLALSLLSQRPRRIYASLYSTVVARFRSRALPGPPSLVSSPSSSPLPRPPSSTNNHSAESDDSFSTSSTT
ncbi:uncharacterized protein LOC144174149 [Haemaphysalis longicornis]